MANQEPQTDEDKMIAKLELHRDIIGKMIELLKKNGIECERTTGNDSNGDILYFNPEDEPKVKAIIRNLPT